MIYVIIALAVVVCLCIYLLSLLMKSNQKQKETESKLQSAYDNSHKLNDFYAKQEEIKENEKQTEQKIDDCASDADLYAVVNDIVRINNEKRNNSSQ